jgi:outer membrane protein TolC
MKNKLESINAVKRLMIALTIGWLVPIPVFAQQQLSLKDALKISMENYGTIKAKASYAQASKADVKQAKLDYLPNFNLAAQADYGTANGQNGPSYGFGPTGIASSGLPLSSQNWNATFGSLFLTNINWDFFAFGRSREKIKTAKAVAARDDYDTKQEEFQQGIRVSAAYLNLLAAQRLTLSYQKNLNRADMLRNIIVKKAKHDLVAGVDSSQANAEVSNAKSILLNAMDYEAEQNRKLVAYLGTPSIQQVATDTLFIARLPENIPGFSDSLFQHPVIQYYKSKIQLSEEQTKYDRTLNYPTISFGGAILTRGSGFSNAYTAQQSNYTDNVWQGIKPDRANYVVGIGITWNLTQPLRVSQQVKSQKLITEGLKDEMILEQQELKAQLTLSDTKIKDAIADYQETPFQVKAANDAYQQKVVLYKNGLTSLVDVTQALYALVRAETDRDIAFNNVWQALLLKAASTGDFSIFYNNLR